ncbi:2Fe-2S iron-sulfur cluster-binding protein [Chryseobacterium rhizosphaerae]|jgi:2Fe-2S ferredoxin|uniref:Ferredoxin n=1 Tax=Chryseobacterium rhizosphaerae TaxID=395937 RepID=A0ABX9IGF2_9FLAO|nr:2Fe-2S iron-sulfur cluster-binding protein [Chryseobacterium rhizosphaerae]MDC8100649.1 2Fe-2S iron-sulfur cluster-binding protein [Chryseobacterium rhizosphaerae]MDR6545142.1 2Fe-2S ferredoxin [Chryseobacterium rhizosphaerae]REC73141.1 ferredoxin [Chryseobacterium rhizosphaerae]GEN67753.1 ferredoxin [Chryseobacterium rhizosphaerae]
MKEEITITVTDPDGNIHTLLCPLEMGLSLKDICKAYELPMEAMCGGMAMCATCHCFILSEAIPLSEKNEIEEALLSELFTTDATSRLACQIYLTAEMDGLAVKIAKD